MGVVVVVDLNIKEIDNKLAQKINIKNHYLHRRSHYVRAYGLFGKDENLVGVCIFGVPGFPTTSKSICGEKYMNNVLELNRLWINDELSKNTESWFVSRCMKLLPKRWSIIVSYSDTKYNHRGIIYQALNFLYLGCSKPSKSYVLREGGHPRRVTKQGKISDKEYKKTLISVEISSKHKYVRFRGSFGVRRELMNNLIKSPVDYP
jgi:hypothetical protein